MQDDLDDLLAAAARRPVQPSEALMERVLADALALQPATAPVFRPALPAPRPGLLARLAAVFGLALGYLNPTTMDYLTGASADTAEFFPETDFLTTEG